jgi:hypothetical protein
MWTQADLATINAAIANGVLRVNFGDREVTYRSMEDLFKARQAVMAYLGIPMTRQIRLSPRSGY